MAMSVIARVVVGKWRICQLTSDLILTRLAKNFMSLVFYSSDFLLESAFKSNALQPVFWSKTFVIPYLSLLVVSSIKKCNRNHKYQWLTRS